jgi:hypothetical protein
LERPLAGDPGLDRLDTDECLDPERLHADDRRGLENVGAEPIEAVGLEFGVAFHGRSV